MVLLKAQIHIAGILQSHSSSPCVVLALNNLQITELCISVH